MSEEKKLDKQEILRHSTAHALAAAVLEMFPETKFGTGPATENGFYYDFMLPRTLIPEDLEILEEKMREIVKANHSFEKEEISIESAIEHFEKISQHYKVELIKDLQKEGNETVSVYKTGGFVDLFYWNLLRMNQSRRKFLREALLEMASYQYLFLKE
ncbi:hypothetical protein ACFL08_05125 [Patescibacteria group bacterium]